MIEPWGVAPPKASLVAFVLAALVAGCAPGEPARLSRAQAVIAETIAKEPDYERYYLSIARGSATPSVRAQVIQALAADNFQTALVAVDALGEAPPPESLEPLRRVFATKGGALKRESAIQLARLGDEKAREYLEGLSADAAQTLSIPATLILARAPGGEERLTPLLRERMSSEDPAVRAEAYAAAGEIRQGWSTRLLLEGLEGERAEQRQPAIVALGRTGDAQVASAIIPFVNTRGLVFASLEALGALGNADARPSVERMLDGDEPAVRVYAAVALWRLGGKDRAVEAVNQLQSSEDPRIRSILAEQLGAVADAEAWSRLATLASDPTKEVRIEAIRAIARQERVEFEPVLREAAADPDYEVATLALAALGRVGGPASSEVAEPLIESDNPYVALSAALCVLEIHGRTPPP
jgi:HEAT repeat protein